MVPQDWRVEDAVFIPDGRGFAYIASKREDPIGKKKYVFIGSAQFGPFDEIKSLALSVGRDSTHIAFAGRNSQGWVLYENGRSIRALWDTGRPYYIEDGITLTYMGLGLHARHPFVAAGGRLLQALGFPPAPWDLDRGYIAVSRMGELTATSPDVMRRPVLLSHA